MVDGAPHGDSADHRARPVHRDIGSLAFRFYVVNFSSYQQTYGLVGSVIVLMLWFYLSGLCLIVGAEMAAEIEHASPLGKDPGERVPGQRKKIGLADSRAYRERQRERPTQGGVLTVQDIVTEAPAVAGVPSSWRDRFLG